MSGAWGEVSHRMVVEDMVRSQKVQIVILQESKLKGGIFKLGVEDRFPFLVP